jgi:hypothetical protein
MIKAPRTWIKNTIVAAALGLVAIATWAVTDSQAPSIEASAAILQQR